MISRLAACLFLSAFGISGAGANIVGCGGNSFSYAEVVPDQRPRQAEGPIVVMPDSLCADLIERPRPGIRSLDIVVDPRTGGEIPLPPQGGAVPRRGKYPDGW